MTEEEARVAGIVAYKAGHPYNPPEIDYGDYPASFHARLAWAAGWRDAAKERADARTAAFNRTYNENAARRGQYDR